jgi:CBS domain-containing protein
MFAEELMTRDVVSIPMTASVHEAAAVMSRRGLSCLPVVDGDQRLVGIVSEIDLIRDRAPRDQRRHLQLDPEERADPPRWVSQVMTSDPQTLPPHADVAELVALMLELKIREVPIVDGPLLVGVVSRRDLLRTLLRTDADIAADIQRELDGLVGEPGRWAAQVEDGVVTLAVSGDAYAFGDDQVATLLAWTVPGVVRVRAGSTGPAVAS